MRTNRICPMFNAAGGSGEGAGALAEGDSSISSGLLKLRIKTASSDTEGSFPRVVSSTVGGKAGGKRSASRFRASELDAHQVDAFEAVKRCLLGIHEDLMEKPDAWPFLSPVRKVEYPHYHAIVRRPLDLGRIRGGLRRGLYQGSAAYLQELEVVRDNCLLFNGADHLYTVNIGRLVEETRARVAADTRLGDAEGAFASALRLDGGPPQRGPPPATAKEHAPAADDSHNSIIEDIILNVEG